jgi:hypothetical protein
MPASNLVSTHRTKTAAAAKKRAIERRGFRATIRETKSSLLKKGYGKYSVFSYGGSRMKNY